MKNKAQIHHTNRWITAMILAIALGPALPFGIGILQMVPCTIMLFHKLNRLAELLSDKSD